MPSSERLSLYLTSNEGSGSGSQDTKEPRRNINWPQSVEGEARLSDICHARGKMGKYLLIPLLEMIDFGAILGIKNLRLVPTRLEYEHNLAKHGRDALANICLPVSYHRNLEEAGIATIPALRDAIARGAFHDIETIEPEGKQAIKAAYEEWVNTFDAWEASRSS